MHRGTSYLSNRSLDDDDNNTSEARAYAANSSSSTDLIRGVGCLIVGAIVLFLLAPSTHQIPEHQQKHIAVSNAVDPRERTRKLPVRLQLLMSQSKVVGNHLEEVKEGKKSVEEVIHSGASLNDVHNDGISGSVHLSRNYKSSPMSLHEVLSFLQSFLKRVNSSNIKNKHATFYGIWNAYHDLALKYLYPWDQEYLKRIPPRREDGSVFLSVVSFRDEFCPETLKQAFAKAKNPSQLFVGLVQQNCEGEKCRSGVMESGKMEDIKEDLDCYLLFCSSPEGKKYCNDGNIRLLKMKESESLGPYMARYFASKLYYILVLFLY